MNKMKSLTSKPAAVRIQWTPNVVGSESRICITRIRWETNRHLIGIAPGGWSNKVSVSLFYKLKYAFRLGKKKCEGGVEYWIPFVRVKHIKSAGGIFP
jgi:hypothetical protein